MKKALVVGGVFIAVGLLAFGLLSPAPEGSIIGPGSTAPDFQAVTIDEPVTQRTLADYRGSVVLLNIWATYCPPCLEEMPTMQKLHDAYADRGLRVVAVSVDDAASGDLIREFRSEQHLTFEILHDPEFAIFDAYALDGVPMTFLIDRDGIIRLTRYAADWFSPGNRAEVERLLRP